jgi:ABC-type transport system involved in cytochrome c biogenesis permease subunit
MTLLVSILAALLSAGPGDAERLSRGDTLPNHLYLEQIRALPVQYEGRWSPLDTVARDVVRQVTGRTRFEGRDPVLTLLAWTFDPQEWSRRPLIPVGDAALRRELRLPAAQTVFSYDDLVGDDYLLSLIDAAANEEPGRKPDPLQAKVRDLNERLVLLQEVFGGEAIRPVPDAEQVLGRWLSIGAAARRDPELLRPAVAAWADLQKAFLADEGPGFASAAERLRTAVAALPAAFKPDPRLIRTELFYNRIHPFGVAWKWMIGGAVLTGIANLIRRRWFDVVTAVVLLTGFAILTYGLWLRWQIAGRLPAANMFESLLLLSWGMGTFAIVAAFVFPYRIVPLMASAMAALALVLADVLLDPAIRPIPPLLQDTIWMSIHVPIIMVSYSVLALGVMLAHGQVLVMATVPRSRGLAATIDALHYWYIHVGSILLLAGIMTGSMWAASSWGRYWGWDPKEVWSLVAFLGYMAILHVRIDLERRSPGMYAIGAVLLVGLFAVVVPLLAPITPTRLLALIGAAAAIVVFATTRGPFAAAVKSILAFWLIIMTYLGVNFVLGTGLHSYGFGTGAVVSWMFWIAGLDLALVSLCAIVYLVHSRRTALAMR